MFKFKIEHAYVTFG